MSSRQSYVDSTVADLKVPPQSLEAEQAIIAAVLQDNHALNICSEQIKPEDFYKEAHKVIFGLMMELSDRGEPVDLVTLTTNLQNKGLLEQAGGAAYLSHILDEIPVASNVAAYAKLVREKSLLRGLIRAATEIVGDCQRTGEDVNELIDKAESRLFAVSQNRDKKSFAQVKNLVVDSYKLIERLYENKGMLTGVATGYPMLDDMTSGLQRGDLIIVAGRPSMGKTAFALNLAFNAAVLGSSVGVFSLEMAKEQLVMRLMTSEARIDASRVRKGELRDDDWPKLSHAADVLSHQKIFIDDQAALSAFEIRAKCRRLAKEHGLDLVVVDYLQLIRGNATAQSREQEISEISRSLKALAKEMNVPVIALSQLNRSVETRTDKRPVMSDLRESGAIEQDADLISFIYRDIVYNPGTADQNVAEIILAKQRNGPTGTVRLAFLKEYTRFENLAFDPGYAGPPPDEF